MADPQNTAPDPPRGKATQLPGPAGRGRRAPVLDDEDEVYEMVNLVPRLTGLPMTVWHKPKGGARHAARIKVNGVHGRRMTMENVASVRLQPVPKVVAGQLTADDRVKVFQWIAMNEKALLDYWNFTIDTDEFLARLRPLP
jgi:hypothetical protein